MHRVKQLHWQKRCLSPFFSNLFSLQLGPASLKRRARSLNADLVLESRPGQELKMRIPA